MDIVKQQISQDELKPGFFQGSSKSGGQSVSEMDDLKSKIDGLQSGSKVKASALAVYDLANRLKKASAYKVDINICAYWTNKLLLPVDDQAALHPESYKRICKDVDKLWPLEESKNSFERKCAYILASVFISGGILIASLMTEGFASGICVAVVGVLLGLAALASKYLNNQTEEHLRVRKEFFNSIEKLADDVAEFNGLKNKSDEEEYKSDEDTENTPFLK